MNLHKYKAKNKIQNMLEAKTSYINVIFVAFNIKFNNVSYSDFFVDETTCSNQ